MQDIELIQDDTGLFDISITDGKIDSVDGFETTITVSLFTDARAPSSIVPDSHRRRGWAGDILKQKGEYTGSHLWLIEQARAVSRTLQQAELYTIAGLQHLIDNNNATAIIVDVAANQRSINISAEIRLSGNKTEQYNTLWRATNGA